MDADPHVIGAYTDGLAAGVLRHQRCLACGAAQTLQRYACRACSSPRLEWRDASGRGVVHACTVVSRAPSDRYKALVPYTLVLVDLDEGARVMAHAEPGVRIGDRVAATFFEHEGLHLVRFRPLTAACA